MPPSPMSSTTAAGQSAGPVPFKDIVVVDAAAAAGGGGARQLPAEEYRDIIATLPRKQSTPFTTVHEYDGAWILDDWLPGTMAFRRRFEARAAGDVVLASLPKCGTTWLKALAFATAARDRYDPSSSGGGDRQHPLRRLNPHECVPFVEVVYNAGEEAKLDAAPSPRIISTHAPYSLLPASITQSSTCKIIYISRQPKDMLISFWHFINKRIKPNIIPFSDIWNSIYNDAYPESPIWEHILGYWNMSKMEPDRVLFLKYEDVLRDPIKNVEKIAEFIGQPFSEAEKEAGIIESIVKLCSLENLKALATNSTGNYQRLMKEVPSESFFRKGVVGDWANYVTPDMAERMDKYLAEKFHGSGFSFTDCL
ncbi:flavonol 3-sulfotransferase-like [Oryza glaberrima]|uniref:flavonol 3-sulfotransferase-like n=1 Tax=Oryza glaberrima TaxID=4538 RepID=UPI00224C3679|nr:flavonol 3-sulfotransferase-like [Oryza glaberrima]